METRDRLAFQHFSRLPIRRELRPAVRRSVLLCEATRSQKATLYTTGEKLSLSHAPAKSSNAPRYILCPKCASAYVGNAVTSRVRVSCPSCSTVFHTSPTELYTAVNATEMTPGPRRPPRRAIICPHMSYCPGCTLSRDVDVPPILTDARAFFNRGFRLKTSPSVDMGLTHAWRTHAKLAIRRGERGERIVLGLFRTHSHTVIPIPGCSVHAPEIDRAVDVVQKVLADSTVLPYDEATGKGLARYALFTVQRATRLVQVTLVWNVACWKDGAPAVQQIGAELWRRGNSILHSVWFNWNTSAGNAIINPEQERFYHMFGERDLVEHICNVRFTFPPYVFRQANLDAFEGLLLPRLFKYIPKGASVAEFCAGAGVIGLTAMRQCNVRRLIASEIHGGAKAEFQKAVFALRAAGFHTESDFVIGSDEETLNIIDNSTDVVIFDPPRGGLSKTVIESLAEFDQESAPKRVIYVSCGLSALKRDTEGLCSHGNWTVSAVHFFVLFPGSDHLETLVIFDRVRDKRKIKEVRDNTNQSAFRKKRVQPSPSTNPKQFRKYNAKAFKRI